MAGQQISFDEVTRELPAAEATLRAHGGFGWLFGGRTQFNVQGIREGLAETGGAAPSNDAVQRWMRLLPGTTYYNSRLGAWARRDDLVVFFARRIGHGGEVAADEAD